MKKVEITAYGAPEAVAHRIEAPDLGASGAGHVALALGAGAARTGRCEVRFAA